jgi:hypothetical protein
MNDIETILAAIFIAIVVTFGVVEVGRWRRPDLSDMLTTTQKARRLIGLGLLLTLGIMALGGSYWPDPRDVPLVVQEMEELYWLFFALLTVFIPLIAFFEYKDSLRRASQLRREVYRQIVTAPLDKLPESDNDADKKTLS